MMPFMRTCNWVQCLQIIVSGVSIKKVKYRIITLETRLFYFYFINWIFQMVKTAAFTIAVKDPVSE